MKNRKDTARQLQAALEAAVQSEDTDFPGAPLHVRGADFGPWSGAAGLGEIETAAPMAPDDKFRTGSVTKPFVAVATLQLVEEGRLSLDDPMTAVLPGSATSRFPASSDQITKRMLLNHASGIPDWLADEAAAEIATNPTRVRTVDEYLTLAAAQEPYFAPGKGFTYSNTDYSLLGLAIEQATGRWHGDAGSGLGNALPIHVATETGALIMQPKVLSGIKARSEDHRLAEAAGAIKSPDQGPGPVS